MNRIQLWSFVFLSVICLSFATKDNYREHMQKVIAKYRNSRKLQMTITTTTYKTVKGATKEEKYSTTVFADKDKYRYETQYLKFVMNKKYLVYADELNHYVFYKVLEKPVAMAQYANLHTPEEWLTVIDSALNYCSDLKYLAGQSSDVFTGNLSKGQYAKFSVAFRKDSTIQNFCYDLRKGYDKEYSKMCVSFSAINFNPSFDQKIFDETTFIRVSGNTVMPVGKYKDFQLMKL